MLLLFDIDHTLITTGGSGMAALTTAGRQLFGPGFTAEGISFSGRLDPLIIGDMFRLNGVADTPEARRQLREVYFGELGPLLARPGVAKALPGVHDLLASLRRNNDVTLGLLTGNFEHTGSMKLKACGIDIEQFHVRVWGDDSPFDPPARDHLVPIGMDRCRGVKPNLAASEVTVIGDTPHDIGCARAHRCRSLGVATGHFTVPQLHEAGADRAVQDLSNVSDIEAWLLGEAVRESIRRV